MRFLKENSRQSCEYRDKFIWFGIHSHTKIVINAVNLEINYIISVACGDKAPYDLKSIDLPASFWLTSSAAAEGQQQRRRRRGRGQRTGRELGFWCAKGMGWAFFFFFLFGLNDVRASTTGPVSALKLDWSIYQNWRQEQTNQRFWRFFSWTWH